MDTDEKIKPPEPKISLHLLLGLSGVGGIFLALTPTKASWYRRLWNWLKNP